MKLMNLRKEGKDHWFLYDATSTTLGRLASDIAMTLMEKDSASYTPNKDNETRNVVVINAGDIKVTGDKIEGKKYYRHSWYLGHLKEFSLKEMLAKDPRRVVEYAVAGMLPKNKMQQKRLNRLHVYSGSEHPHTQVKE